MADLATLQTRLLEAELAKHKLLTGTMEVEVEFNGIRTKYSNSVSQLNLLDDYINKLKSDISDAGGESFTKRRSMVVDLPGSC